MSKFKRHAKIMEIISENHIYTQEQLLEKLHQAGFSVTQATVSRDIRELRLVKVQMSDGGYCYSGAKAQDSHISFRFHAIFKEAVSKIDCAQNLIVIKCYTGMANAACAALDTIEWQGSVGTIAGDDTILIIMRDSESAAALVDELYQLLSRSKA